MSLYSHYSWGCKRLNGEENHTRQFTVTKTVGSYVNYGKGCTYFIRFKFNNLHCSEGQVG